MRDVLYPLKISFCATPIMLFSSIPLVQAQNKSTNYKMTLVPLKTTPPVDTGGFILSNPSDLKVTLAEHIMTIKYHDKSVRTTDIQELNKFIKGNNIKKMNPGILLEISPKTQNEEVKKIIDILNRNGITHFAIKILE
ncbi:hypothetical protein ACTHGU_07640 [Chitinophagaceae bacterium MMS25-I14]